MSKVLATLLRLLAIPWIGSAMGLAILYQVAVCGLTLPAPQLLLVFCLVPPMLFSAAPVSALGDVVAAWWAGYTLVEVSAFLVALRRAGLAGPWRFRRTPRLDFPPAVTALARDTTDLRRSHLTFVLGGVVTLSLVAVLGLALGQAIYSPLDGVARFGFRPPADIAFLFPNTLPIAVLNLWAIVCGGFGLASLVLSGPGTPPSPGTQLLFLLREPHVERDIRVTAQ